MEEQEATSDYIKRVNDGYLLAKHMPELAAQLKEATKDREDGFTAGIKQFENEKEMDQDRLPSWMNKDRLSSFDKDNDLLKDKDDLDRE